MSSHQDISIVFTGTNDNEIDIDDALPDGFTYFYTYQYTPGSSNICNIMVCDAIDNYLVYNIGDTIELYWSDDDDCYYLSGL